MESLIPVINQLQDVCLSATIPLQIDLPQIIVVGIQSSGKSSVIEAIVKREFLPRGSGIVTRRPLVIRLFKIEDVHSHDWVKFKHLDREFTDFDEVRQEIENETERLCGANKGICAEPITLSVYSKNVVNLTLVDLPGITRNPVGDQPEDIEERTRELVMSYIKNPNSIILAVTAANVDFPTSEAIQLARRVDPEGRRTLAVLTKLDTMEPGTDALDVLSGKVIAIRLGIIGVVNRAQHDIINKKPIKAAIEDEASFFQKHYPTIADKHGQPYLSQRLSQILMRHIRDCLPDLKARTNSLTAQYEAQLKLYGEPVVDKAKTIIDNLTKFSLSYEDTIKGSKQQMKTTELCGGARILYIFHESFGRALMAINPLENLDSKAILTAARNAAGVRTTISTPDVFELLVTNQIKRLEEPSLRCVDLVHDEMVRFSRQCGDQERFPKLKKKIEDILARILNERLPATREAVKNLVAFEYALIDTEHPRLRETYFSSEQAKTNDITTGHERELRECEAIARKIDAYFNIVRDDITRFVPKAIMCCMVNHVLSNIQSALIKEIYEKELFDELLSESDDIAKRRKHAEEMLVALRKAGEIISSYRV